MSLRTTGAKAKEPNRGEGEKVKRSISHDNIYGWNFTKLCKYCGGTERHHHHRVHFVA